MKTLLLDFSNIAHATFYVITTDRSVSSKTDPFCTERIQYWKYLMLNSIQSQIKIHKPHELIVCIDSPSWRKKAFKYYKASRAKSREESKFDFAQFYANIDGFVEDLRTHFPYTIIKSKNAEADDIIGVLVYYLKNERDEIVVASNDKDMKQLLCNNVKLWSILKKEWLIVDNVNKYLLQHVLTGDSSDGIPNVRSDDDVFISEGKRQKPCGPKTVEKIMEYGIKEWITDNGLIRNWKRNYKLISLSYGVIPKSVSNSIIKAYDEKEDKKPDFMKILQYIRKNKFRTLEARANNFILPKLKEKTILENFNF